MFDKLIESSTAGAGIPPRRRYFLISSIVVGILFVTAVVASLYAADIDLGVDDFDMARMLVPEMPDEPEPEAPLPQRASAAPTSEMPSRRANIQQMDETPVAATEISTKPNTGLSRPDFAFRLSDGIESNNVGSRPAATGSSCGNCGSGSSTSTPEVARVNEPDPGPPPPVKKPEVPQRPVSIGVANGHATYLPKPAYPSPAIAVGAQGKVDVQVTIDEEGKVISAKAASGHPLLRQAAEKAAWQARFTPTLLSKVPVKVTGVIVYNFTR